MDNANLAAIEQAKKAVECLLYWHFADRDPAREADVCIEAQSAIDDLVQSDAIRKLKTNALARRKAEFVEKRGATNCDDILIGEHNTRTAAESQERLKGPIGQLLGVDHLFEQEEV